MGKKAYQIDEVAIKTGLTKRALRYYDDIDLISPLRTESGYRVYSEEDVEKLLRIKEIKESLGFCLSDIKEILELEENLQDIFEGNTTNINLVEKSLAMMERQIELVAKKEQTIAKVKIKYQQTFADLNKFYIQLKERTKHEEN